MEAEDVPDFARRRTNGIEKRKRIRHHHRILHIPLDGGPYLPRAKLFSVRIVPPDKRRHRTKDAALMDFQQRCRSSQRLSPIEVFQLHTKRLLEPRPGDFMREKRRQ
jgi:hypothetical protein